MRFLIQIPQLIFGGAEKVLVSFANDLVSRGHEVEVLETYEKGLLRDQFNERVTFSAICSNEYTAKYYASPAQVKKKPFLMGKWLFSKVVGYRRFAVKLAAKHYTQKSYDVAINYLEIEAPTFLLEHIQAKKYIQWFHTDIANDTHPEDSDRMLPEWERMDAVVCVSKNAFENFRSRYPSLVEKTHLIYNYFDADMIRQKGAVPYCFEGLRPVLLSVGRMTEPKQYPRFLDVLARLRDEGFDFSWHVLGDGIQRPQIEEKIRTLALSDRVYLHGLSDNPYKYMKNCDLFVLPSGWEGFPTVTVEAKLLGCPVLATDVAGIREQLTHGKTGWIVDNSEDAL
ncbi:MAG: glycosyltransferase, partial [Oscillospiraceae bacterium]|nr:glycosyltransferase [Oscillospiraceae bacterium]